MVGELVISDIYQQAWVAGVRGGGSGTNVHVTFDPASLEGVETGQMTCYFDNKSAKLQNKRRDNNCLFVAYFRGEANSYEELEMEMSFRCPGAEEQEGRAPRQKKEEKKKESIPYELEKDQAVIVYKYKGEDREVKLDKVREERMIPYC